MSRTTRCRSCPPLRSRPTISFASLRTTLRIGVATEHADQRPKRFGRGRLGLVQRHEAHLSWPTGKCLSQYGTVAQVIASAFASGMSAAAAVEGHPVFCPLHAAALTSPDGHPRTFRCRQSRLGAVSRLIGGRWLGQGVGRIFRSKVEGYPTTSERRVGLPGGEKGGLVAKPALGRCEKGPSPRHTRKSEGAPAQLSAASLQIAGQRRDASWDSASTDYDGDRNAGQTQGLARSHGGHNV